VYCLLVVSHSRESGELTYFPDLIRFSYSFRSLSLELLDREVEVWRCGTSRGPVDASPICHTVCLVNGEK